MHMTTSRLTARLDKLQSNQPRSMCIHPQPGESEVDLACRAAAVGYPVVLAPKPCTTVEEWLALCGNQQLLNSSRRGLLNLRGLEAATSP